MSTVRLMTLALALAACSCAASTTPSELDDAAADNVEPDAGADVTDVVDATPAPVVDAGAPVVVADASTPAQPVVDATTPDADRGAPAADAATPSEPVDAGSDAAHTEPEPDASAPAPKLTQCKLASGVVLTCANQSVYGAQLRWNVGNTSYPCNVVPVEQCEKGSTCSAFLSNNTTEQGVCQ